jgi:hypothetical protein
MKFCEKTRLLRSIVILALVPFTKQWAGEPECNVELVLQVTRTDLEITRDSQRLAAQRQTTTVHVHSEAFSIALRNKGQDSVVLVEPGHRSGSGGRTPIVSWEREQDGTFVSSSVMSVGGCGNRNTLKADEVFELRPSESRTLAGWIPKLSFPGSGTYRLRFHYINDPHHKWMDIPLGRDDETAMERIRANTPCNLLSNVVEVTVGPSASK